MLGMLCQSVMNQHKVTTRNSDIIKLTALLHWQWCKTYGFDRHEKYYEQFVAKETRVLESIL